jgi:hypothetical protein
MIKNFTTTRKYKQENAALYYIGFRDKLPTFCMDFEARPDEFT